MAVGSTAHMLLNSLLAYMVLAYFVMAVKYAVKFFITLTPGLVTSEGGAFFNKLAHGANVPTFYKLL